MAVRSIKQNDRSLTGGFHSNKVNTLIEYESSLEKDFFIWCEFNPRVDEYLHQPMHIEYICERGINRIYTPDVLVIFNDSRPPTLYEVKYREDIKEQFWLNKAKYRAAIKYCVQRGWKFEFIDESIRTDYLKNIKFLMNFNIDDITTEIKDKILVHLNCLKLFTPKEFIESFAQTEEIRGHYLRYFWIMVLKRIIICDLTKPLNMNTKCQLKEDYENKY